MARRLSNPGREQKAYPTRKSKEPGDASSDDAPVLPPVARPPSSLTNETVERRVQDWGIYRRPERRLLVVTEPDDRFSPRCRVVRIASGVPPEDGTARVGKLPRKGPVNSDKSVFNELLYLSVAQF